MTPWKLDVPRDDSKETPIGNCYGWQRACPHALHNPASEPQPVRWAAIKIHAAVVLVALTKTEGEEVS